jgi:DNA-binding NarL/FixJ family response regulator
LVEDHVLVRQSIRAFLQGAAFEVVGEASTGSEALQVHLQAIYQKLNVTNRTEAVLRAMVLGIVHPTEGAIE